MHPRKYLELWTNGFKKTGMNLVHRNLEDVQEKNPFQIRKIPNPKILLPDHQWFIILENNMRKLFLSTLFLPIHFQEVQWCHNSNF